MYRTIWCVIVLMLAAACGGPEAERSRARANAVVATAGTAAADEKLPAIDQTRLLEHIKVLASDRFEGRAPGGTGEDLTVSYIAEEFKKAGAQPGNPDGTYFQKVPLVGITPAPAPLVVAKGDERTSLKWKDDFVAWTKHVAGSASLDNSEIVFVGYGVVAPEFNWDDYKGLDVAGKTLVMLVGDPPVPDPATPSALDPKMFGGPAMTYYGRWTYKYDIGAEKGAAGVLIVHETAPAGYPFGVVQAKTGEQFDLVTPDKNMGRASVEGWIALEQAKAMFARAGQDFEALKKQAVARDFKPVPLGLTASITLKNTLRNVDSRNVIAKVEGSDSKVRDEYVIYTAHWDHLGMDPKLEGDKIYNGAVDNASGTAALIEMARSVAALQTKPRRTVLFLAVTAEEQGLLGSQYYSVQPLYPLAKTVAVINMDAMNVYGRTKDLTVIGLGMSDLDDYARDAAAEQGRTLRSDPEPEKGFYYRSDHFNFAKQGVPALNIEDGSQFVGKPEGYSRRVRENWTTNIYHKPGDEVRPDWDLTGLVEDAQLLMTVGYRVANAAKYPEWKPGTEFKAIRDEQLKNRT